MKTRIILLAVTLVAAGLPAVSRAAAEGVEKADVIVYGATPSGIMAAVAAARQGHTVALVDRNNHVGGVVSSGLVDTDIGDRRTVGGLADDFLRRVVTFYREKYGPDSKQLTACRNGLKYEPHVAEAIFEQLLTEQQPRITVWKRHRYRSVTLDGGRITALVADDLAGGGTRTFGGTVFIDASYEGDLMAGAHVPYRVGREGRAEYGEYLAGISAGPKELRGLGDHCTMAYNYRVSITSNPDNRVLFPKPEHYDPEPFRRTDGERIKRGGISGFGGLYTTTVGKAGPNDKYDSNWGDLMGNGEGYAEGDWDTRARLEARERDYFLSRLYYVQNDPELPEAFRAEARHWGLPKDEFTDNGHFPFQIYVREARRMLGRYVLREHDLTHDRSKVDGICAGSYGVDCHVVRYVLDKGVLVREHTPHVAVNPYDIPYACLTPYEPGNLLVPVCLSASHVAYCSLRMEPVYMMLGQAAGDAAHLALAGGTAVQKIDVQQLRELLRKEGTILDAGYEPPVKIAYTPEHPQPGEAVQFHVESGTLKDPLKQVWWDFEGDGRVSAQGEKAEHAFSLEKVYSASLLVQDKAGRRRLVAVEVPVGRASARDVTLDDSEADLFGRWDSVRPDVFFGPGVHGDNVRAGKKSPARARFQPTIPRAGRYQVCLGFRPAKGQATNVPVTIRYAGGTRKLTVDERKETTPFAFVPLGEFRFKASDSGFVEVTNGGTDGRVVIDAVRWVWLGE